MAAIYILRINIVEINLSELILKLTWKKNYVQCYPLYCYFWDTKTRVNNQHENMAKNKKRWSFVDKVETHPQLNLFYHRVIPWMATGVSNAVQLVTEGIFAVNTWMMFSFVLVPPLVFVRYYSISEKNGNVWFRGFVISTKMYPFLIMWTPVYWYSKQYIWDNFTSPELKFNLVLCIWIQRTLQTKNPNSMRTHAVVLFFISLQCEQSLFTFCRCRCFREFRQIPHLNRDVKTNCNYNTRCGTHPCLNSNRDLIAK